MCGIFGFVEKTSSGIAKTLQEKDTLLKNSTTVISHRGPDDVAYYLDDNCGLGMRRLAILDLTPDLYPFKSADGSKELIFNGEIYNYPLLKKELESKGCEFKTGCDAEAILFGYELWGPEILKKLRGMFAIAIWDKNKRELFLARDRLGIKPIYYIDDNKSFFFSSEVKALLASNQNKPSLNYDNIKLMLGFMYLPDSEDTTIKGIKRMPPATYALVKEGQLKITKYWDINDVKENTSITFEDATQRLDELLNETVSQHLMADVPLGMLLSGGLDSSLLTAIITKNKLQNSLDTFTAKFDHKFNESDLAKDTAAYLGTNHNEIFIDTNDINNNIEKYIGLYDDLTTFDGGTFTTKLLSQKIQERGIKVLLLGEGADEIFGGYSWFGLSQYPFKLLPPIIRNALYYYSISRNVNTNFWFYANKWNSLQHDSFDAFRDITKRELGIQLPNHLLMKVDKGSMSESIEARVPYMDHELVEFVYSLPQEMKLKGKVFNFDRSNEKYILREVAKKYLKPEVVSRKKKGFFLPMGDVLNQNISKVKDYVYREDSVAKKVFSTTTLDKFFDTNAPNIIKMQNEYFLWRLFLLETWAHHYNLK